MTRDDKPKLNTGDLIAHMKSKGIKFNYISDSDAIKFLETKNYYFKVTAYRSNFSKTDGKYNDLDFYMLVDLAALDAWLRRYLNPIALNVEHGFKVKLLNMINNDETLDGYDIVDEFRTYSDETADAYNQTINYLKGNDYSRGLYEKHHDDFSIWVLIESMTFGSLAQFAKFYADKYANPGSQFRTLQLQMQSAKRIRNAVSHSNPLLINLDNEAGLFPINPENNKRRRPSASVVSAAEQMNIDKEALRNVKIHDLVALFYLNKRLTSKEAREHMVRDGESLIQRFDKHRDYYSDIKPLLDFKEILIKLVDFQLS